MRIFIFLKSTDNRQQTTDFDHFFSRKDAKKRKVLRIF